MPVLHLAEAISDVEQALGISDSDLGRAFDVSERTVERWRTTETYPQQKGRECLAQLMDLRVHLYDTFRTAEAVRTWMRTANRYLAGLTPIEVLRARTGMRA